MKKTIYIILTLSTIIAINSCGKSSSGGTEEPSTPPDTGNPDSGGGQTVIDPKAATLVFPENNSICTEGKDFTATTSTITFKWTGEATDASPTKYEITLTDVDANTTRDLETTAKTNDVSFDIADLKRGRQYTWVITATKDGSDKTEVSDEFTFFNAGVAAESFAPKPALPISPERNKRINFSDGNTVTLEWQGNDQDGDIKEYDVLFGTENPPTVILETVTAPTSKVENVTIEAGNTYYWRILTRDEEGNQSGSAVFKFDIL